MKHYILIIVLTFLHIAMILMLVTGCTGGCEYESIVCHDSRCYARNSCYSTFDDCQKNVQFEKEFCMIKLKEKENED